MMAFEDLSNPLDRVSHAVLHERTEPGDGASDDQGVHLARAFVGVDRFGVGDEASDVVLQQNSVATQ